ncbi:hypothetical protein GCM10010420_02780 [Streptomyces glaucosporus]|uniref:Zinc-finger domain-containing protein n=1 Tax=Streptomyces glaucosporus TaxID=284044 RepID=A0ABN3HNR2_9ACTN
MTSASSASFDMDEHPEVAEISAHAEGVLPPQRSADIRSHLADCELCSDVQMSLAEIRSVLGTLPGPARMPSDVASRIDAALAAEALLGASTPTPDESQPTAGERQSQEEPSTVSRETTATRTVSRGTAPMDRSTGRPSGHARSATGPGRSTRRPRRWRTALLGTAAAAALIAFGAFLLPGFSGAEAGGSGVASDSGQHSKSDVADEALEAQVRSLLAKSGTAGKPERQEKTKPEDAHGFTTRARPHTPLNTSAVALPSCVREGVDRDETPLAVGMDTYAGQRAYLVVLPHESDSTRVDAYVVDADCVGKASPEPGTVLITRTYER